jgi:hypothetical protein
MTKVALILFFLSFFLSCCAAGIPTAPSFPDRESLIPPAQVKILPETDIYPPRSVTDEYAAPAPLPYPVNTAGAEDSAFILPDGKTLYLWYTPDPDAPLERQLADGVTGIYRFQRLGEVWGTAERITLQDPGKLALDGCAFVLDDRMWFCSAREGYNDLGWFTADQSNGRWHNWRKVNFPEAYQVGELHITTDGEEIFFHSSRPGGKGGYDIWTSKKVGDAWGEPVNLAVVNSEHTDGWPFVTPDGSELWFTRSNGAAELWRSRRVDGVWSPPEQMFTHFAAEASLDLDGNVYFSHHYFKDDRMLEADIYIARRKGK